MTACNLLKSVRCVLYVQAHEVSLNSKLRGERKMLCAKTAKPLFLALPLLFSCAVQAAIIDHGDYLTDTATSLDWLDVTKTVNMSYSDVSTQLGVGGLFQGWRYATGNEFNVMVGNHTGVAIPSVTYGNVNQEVDKIDVLVALLGSTLDAEYIKKYSRTYDAYNNFQEGAGRDYTAGIVADFVSSFEIFVGILSDDDRSPTTADFSSAHYTSTNIFARRDSIGSYLIRSNAPSVPEPTTIALFALGLVGLAAARGRIGHQPG
jgi:hypothetical protein